MTERVPKAEEAVTVILSNIDCQYSKEFHLDLLKFLVQSILPHGSVDKCEGIPEIYRTMRHSQALKHKDYRMVVSILRHFLQMTGCEQATELSGHCCKEFDLIAVVPTLPSYQLLFCLAHEILKNKNYERLLNSIDEKTLNKSKYDLHNAEELFQSMICKEALHPCNPSLLKEELETLLEATHLEQELQFVQHTMIISHDKMALLFDFEGHPISGEKQAIAVRGPVMTTYYLGAKKFPPDTESDTDDDKGFVRREEIDVKQSKPLLNERNPSEMAETGVGQASNGGTYLSKTANRRSTSPKWKLACCYVGCVLLLIITMVGSASLFIYAAKASDLSHTQPIYGFRTEPFVYSPFSNIDLFYYVSIRGTIHGTDDDSNYNYTVCAASCPLRVTTLTSLVNGGCPSDRYYSNCYVNFLLYQHAGLNPQHFSRYMLSNSNVTFTITNLSCTEPVQLCITTDKDTCGQILTGNSTDCPNTEQRLVFNEVNNYSQTFTAHDDGYYCAVWLIKEPNNSINYTADLTVVSYQLPTSGCETFYTNEFTLDLWHHQLNVAATHKRGICILVQENAVYTDTTTLSTTVIASFFNNLAFVFGVIFATLIIIVMVIIITVICYKYTCNKFVKPSSYCT